MNDGLLYWIWLSLSTTPGKTTFAKLIGHFNTPKDIFDADDDEIKSCIGSQNKDYNQIVERSLEKASRILDFCKKKNVGILTYDSDRYPALLRKIPNPPVLLYYRGKLPYFDVSLCIGVVGTRSMTEYGKRNAFRISADLARAGAIIVSGMAFGIDAVAAAAAVASDAPTVAVLGSGIDVCYPKEHLTLAREIVKRGCIMTEYPPGARPYGYHFPQRNRIISGLSAATVVIEGSEISGALITARNAKEQDRIIYALPGNVDSATSEVPILLLKNGARAFASADDIVRDFDRTHPGALNPFRLNEPGPGDVDEILKRLSVSFIRKNKRRKFDPNEPTECEHAPTPIDDTARPDTPIKPQRQISFDGISKEAIALYHKIPLDSDISIDELAATEGGIRNVMSLLMKLELGSFITMLPGERVKRKLH